MSRRKKDCRLLRDHRVSPQLFDDNTCHEAAERIRKAKNEESKAVVVSEIVQKWQEKAHQSIDKKRQQIRSKRRVWHADINLGVVARFAHVPDTQLTQVDGIALRIMCTRRTKKSFTLICWGGPDEKVVLKTTERDIASFPKPEVASMTFNIKDGVDGDAPGIYLGRFDNFVKQRGMGHRVFCTLLRYLMQEHLLKPHDVMSLEAHGQVPGPPRVVAGSYLSREQELMVQAYEKFGGSSEAVNLVAYYTKLGFHILRPLEFLLDIVQEDGVYMYATVQDLERVCRRRFWKPAWWSLSAIIGGI